MRKFLVIIAGLIALSFISIICISILLCIRDLNYIYLNAVAISAIILYFYFTKWRKEDED